MQPLGTEPAANSLRAFAEGPAVKLDLPRHSPDPGLSELEDSFALVAGQIQLCVSVTLNVVDIVDRLVPPPPDNSPPAEVESSDSSWNEDDIF